MIFDNTLNTQTVLLDYKHTVVDKIWDVYKRQVQNGAKDWSLRDDVGKAWHYDFQFLLFGQLATKSLHLDVKR